jgi:DNA-binding response OmpR family regulator
MATVGLQTCDEGDCEPREGDPVDNRQECVLLVEDDEEAMLLVRYALQEYGNGTYRLEWADGLTASLHRLANGGVDLVILDLGLPESSGPASYEALRKAAPDLPILVLTGDTRESTELKVAADGVEDFLVKDEVSGGLLVQAIRAALYSNRRWQEQRNVAYKTKPRFLWAQEQCQALSGLAMRMLKLQRIESVIACTKAIAAVACDHNEAGHAGVAGRADLFVFLERLARVADAQGLRESARRFRAMIVPQANADEAGRAEFAAAVRRRNQELDRDAGPESTDLAHVL